LRFFRRKQTFANHGCDERVIVRQLTDLVITHEVDPRITDVREPPFAFAKCERRCRGAHAAEVGVRLCFRKDAGVRACERVAKCRSDVVTFACEVLRLDRFCSEPRCSRAAAMATHAVGYDKEPATGLART